VFSIQRSNAFVIPNQHPFIHLCVFLQKVTGVLYLKIEKNTVGKWSLQMWQYLPERKQLIG
jgi:hypothetical protein